MARVLGIGGLFFRAKDTSALAGWYREHLGVTELWQQEAGPTVFAPFREESDYFPAGRQWMINLRVEDLDGLIERFRAAGISVETRPHEWDDPQTGRFARIVDPEGNHIELWEPPPA